MKRLLVISISAVLLTIGTCAYGYASGSLTGWQGAALQRNRDRANNVAPRAPVPAETLAASGNLTGWQGTAMQRNRDSMNAMGGAESTGGINSDTGGTDNASSPFTGWHGPAKNRNRTSNP